MWLHHVKVKHLLTPGTSHAEVQQNMNDIADVLEKTECFARFKDSLPRFRRIPVGDDVFAPEDYANKLLDEMYNFADIHLIWME